MFTATLGHQTDSTGSTIDGGTAITQLLTEADSRLELGPYNVFNVGGDKSLVAFSVDSTYQGVDRSIFVDAVESTSHPALTEIKVCAPSQ